MSPCMGRFSWIEGVQSLWVFAVASVDTTTVAVGRGRPELKKSARVGTGADFRVDEQIRLVELFFFCRSGQGRYGRSTALNDRRDLIKVAGADFLLV